MFHNEALQTLDVLVAAVVEEPPRDDPPPSPALGAAYLVGDSPTGDWAGHSGSVAAYTSGGWRLIPPVEGMAVYVRASGCSAVYRAGAWELGVIRGSSLVIGGEQVVGPRLAAIAGPIGGATIDTEARSAIEQILTAMRQHGFIET